MGYTFFDATFSVQIANFDSIEYDQPMWTLLFLVGEDSRDCNGGLQEARSALVVSRTTLLQ